LANDLWIDSVPTCLECLTLPEQMLVSLHFTQFFVYKMYPKHAGGAWLPEDQRQQAIRGNVVLVKWNTDHVVDMVEGRILPRPLKILVLVIAVLFIGVGKLPKNWLYSTFCVRRQQVLNALILSRTCLGIWLKDNNPLYCDIQIDAACIAALPEDEVPINI
ncbi:hypothetical protein BKA62DRAFT_591733, partial [Auriculariales sp. MPI-PUGE-AT-0066]